MWFNGIVCSINKYLVIMFLVLVAGCQNFVQNRYIYSFHTNGNLFLYSILDEKLKPHLYKSGLDGDLIELYPGQKLHTYDGIVGAKNVYYVSYDDDNKISYLNICSLKVLNCSVIFQMTGSIRDPIEISEDKILFQRSEFDESTHSDSGYANFNFYFYEDGVIGKLESDTFASVGPALRVKGEVYFSAIFPGQNNFSTENENVNTVSSNYVANISENKIEISKINNNLFGEYNIVFSYEYFGHGLYFVGVPGNDGRYVYQTCILKKNEQNICDNSEVRTTHPVLVNNTVYYAIWSSKNRKVVELNSIDLKGGEHDG